MLKRISFLILIVTYSVCSFAQGNEYDYVEEKPFLTKKEFGFGAVLHTNGWGISFRKGENITVNKKRFYEIEFIGMKHPKEYKTVSYLGDKPKSFVYGKMNALLIGHGGYRFEKILFSKTERNTFEIRLHATGGFSLGITKAIYYLKDADVYDNRTVFKFYPDSLSNPTPDNIKGKAEFTKGLDELKFYPGIYLKAGTMFEYNPMNDGITAVEVGMMVDVYGKKIPIMAFAKNKQVWFNLYATLIIGRKS